MIQEITEAIESLLESFDKNKYNISLGFFEGYATVESDTSGKRFCDLKLHYKDEESVDIPLTGIPLMYIGSKSFLTDFELVSGDELLVFFSDRTLEQWKPTSGTVPQDLKDPVKDSLNHAFAIPVCTTHNASLVTTAPLDSTVGGRLGVKSGKKAQVGNDTTDLLKILHSLITSLLLGTTVTTTNTINGNGIFTDAATITTLQTQLATITKL